MAGNQQVVKELLGSQAEQQVKTRGVGAYVKKPIRATKVEIKSYPDFSYLSRCYFSLSVFVKSSLVSWKSSN